MTREEAIKIIKEFISRTCLHLVDQEALETLIPELTCEDERIRREIIDFIQWAEERGMTRHDFHQAKRPSEWIAYLEKQKKSSTDYFSTNHIETFPDGTTVRHTIGYLEKQKKHPSDPCKTCKGFQETGKCFVDDCEAKMEQKEQKTVEKQDYSGLSNLERVIHRGFLAAGLEDVPVTIIKETAKECVAQMKPAEWDGYTKTNLDRALQIIKDAKGKLQGYQSDDGIYECDKAIECLEHFLYRGLEIEKPAEWSEDDEEMAQFYSDDYNNRLGDKPMKWVLEMRLRFKEWLTTRLKSLRPRPQWKPTEEQMKALKRCVDGWTDDGDGTLDSLYNDLKKLM